MIDTTVSLESRTSLPHRAPAPYSPHVLGPKEQAQHLLQSIEAGLSHTALNMSQRIAMAQVYATLHLAEVVSEGGVRDSMVAI